MKLWEFNKITGYWIFVRNVTPETKIQWLNIFKKDNPDGIYKVCKNKPK